MEHSYVNMENKVCFIGHRQIFDRGLEHRLYHEVESQIKKGHKTFTMGTHGDFDRLALGVCRNLRKIYTDIKIEVVVTSFAQIKPKIYHDEFYGNEVFKPYEDVVTIMFDIEESHFKQKITESNRQMINSCDTLICYVDTSYK